MSLSSYGALETRDAPRKRLNAIGSVPGCAIGLER